MDGDIPVRFDTRTPPEAEARANMAINEQRGLPEAVPLRSVIIVGSGPSARDEALWERLRTIPAHCLGILRTDHPARPTIVALNGALKLFLDRGLRPDYWCVCDQQALVADFLPDDPPRAMTYLLASKVHPSVFDKLKGRDVRIWRLDDFEPAPASKVAIPCAVSITLVTQALFHALGYHRLEMYGWDCCFLNGEHHATPQDQGAPETMAVDLLTEDGKSLATFQTTGTWAAEITDAATMAHNLVTMGCEIVVHGPGMVGAVLRGRGVI
jgi:hypothetical protein